MRSTFSYLKNELKPLLHKQYLKEDIFAGITVACVAIPLSLAIAIASNVSPGTGLISAIIGGIIAAFLGGTTLAVTGPAAAMAVLIASNVEQYGMSGLIVIGFVCGILQFIFGVTKLGRYAKLVPLPVIAAFTAGIGFIIIIGQLPKALQLPSPDQNHVFYVIQHIGHYIKDMNPVAFLIATLTILMLRIMPRYYPKLPTPLITVVLATLAVRFWHLDSITLVGTIPHSLNMPTLPNFAAIQDWSGLITSAVTVFALASLETLLSSSAVDLMGNGSLHNSNQELIGQGVANISVSLFGGLPVTGVIARSTVNISAGAKTRRSAIVHSVVILGAIYLCPNLIEQIPIAALAGILLNAGLSMIKIKEFLDFWKIDKNEAAIYLVTFISIIALDLVEGVKAGMIAAFLIVALKMLKTKMNIHLWTNKSVMRIELAGSMTFWSFDKLHKIQEYVLLHPQLRFVIFEFSGINNFDISGTNHLITISKAIHNQGVKVIFHQLNLSTKHILLNVEHNENSLWVETQTESEIKTILGEEGITHSADELLRYGVQKYLVEFAREKKLLIEVLSQGQNPHTLLITCSDSRLNPNSFLSAELGELFIVRNIGNIVPKYTESANHSEVAAIEFALNHLQIKHIVVCAHTECGAIKAALDSQATTNIPLNNWLNIIRQDFKQMPHDITEGVKINLGNQIENLKTYPLVQKLLHENTLTIAAWVYDVKSANMLEYDMLESKLISLIK